ncbi:MAG: carboxypeptidase regulatory-like domain-containing protein [Planctomycetaceae bacterium]|nr:carboxypeptidase regulatory-like domain-containing protein [Planctomycetaceae bacterium]
MTRPTRLLAILTLGLFSISLTIGCGGGDESDSSSSKPSDAVAPTADEEPEEEAPVAEKIEEPAAPEEKPAEKPKTTTSNEAGGMGSIKGVIKLTGAIPELPVLIKQGDSTAKDSEVCAAEPVPDESLVVNSANSGIANVFIYMRKAPKGAPESEPSSEPVIFDQKGCQFVPHALFVQTGRPIKAVSSDAVPHNLHTNPIKNSPVNQIIAPNDKSGLDLTYSEGEIVPVKVTCDIHPWMVAWHFPLEHPYGAVTDENGNFTIENLPPGDHEFRIWQEKAGYLDKEFTVTVKAGEATEVTLEYPADTFSDDE